MAGGAAAEGLLAPTLCLKLKRRESVAAALGGPSLEEAGAAGDSPDATAARRVNELALRWASSRQVTTGSGGGESGGALLSFGDDRELQDDPAGPFGNKGGAYVESRIGLATVAPPASGERPRLRVTSPTITTPLSGVPEAFLASHYMKVLCPFGGGGLGTAWEKE